MTLARRFSILAAFALLAPAFLLGSFAHAQTASMDQLRATIKTEIMSDPRSQNLSQAQIYTLVNALATQAEKQGLTTTALTYRPEAPVQPAPSTFCSGFSCSFSQAFGLDGSIPILPIALIVLAILFIAIYSLMREIGHPHVQA